MTYTAEQYKQFQKEAPQLVNKLNDNNLKIIRAIKDFNLNDRKPFNDEIASRTKLTKGQVNSALTKLKNMDLIASIKWSQDKRISKWIATSKADMLLSYLKSKEKRRLRVFEKNLMADMNDPIKISRARIEKANKPLYKLKTYHPAIPMDKIITILENNHIYPIQEDGTRFSTLFHGGVDKTERVSIKVAVFDDKKEKFRVVDNTNLIMTYYKMPHSDNYEIGVYLS